MSEVRTPDPARLVHFLLRDMSRAIREYAMLADGDRVAVAVSGGKDSLALLALLQAHARTAGIAYTMTAVHVRGDASGVTLAHPPLDDWLATQGVMYRIVEPELNDQDEKPLHCARCTWLRRKAIFLAAAELDCNVVAFAHHADDAAQTTLLNLLYGGNLRGLAPVADYFAGRFRLIRPLIYTPEKELRRFARVGGFPPPPPLCARADDSRRARVTAMLKLLGRDYAQARANLVRAGIAHIRPGLSGD